MAIPTTVSIQGDGPLGDLFGTMSYESFGPGAGQLIFDLTNSSPPDNGGYLTAFVFNVPSPATFDDFTFSSSVTRAQFEVIINDGTKNSPTKAQPYGTFDLGASSTGQFLGGGNPTYGLPVGASGTFTFTFTGTGLDLLTVDSFIEAGTSLSAYEDGAFFIARFRGFDDGGSNKTITTYTPSVPDSSGTFALLAISGAGLMALKRRASRRTA